jgi:hypothetical protein
MELELLKLFFPEELVAHFDITGSAIVDFPNNRTGN